MSERDEVERAGDARASKQQSVGRFAKILKAQFEQTGMSTSQFEAVHGYANGSVTRYSNGQVVPPPQYIEDLLGEVEQRLPLQPGVADQVRSGYGRLLDTLCSADRPHPMHQLMRRLFVAEQAVLTIAAEHAEVLRKLQQYRDGLDMAISDRDAERQRRLKQQIVRAQKEEQAVARRRASTVAQRDTARSELVEYNDGRLKTPARPVRAEPVSDPGGGHVHRPGRQELPEANRPMSANPGQGEGRWRFLVVTAAATVVALVLGLALILPDRGRSDQAKDGAPTTPGQPARAPEPSPDTPTPSTSMPSTPADLFWTPSSNPPPRPTQTSSEPTPPPPATSVYWSRPMVVGYGGRDLDSDPAEADVSGKDLSTSLAKGDRVEIHPGLTSNKLVPIAASETARIDAAYCRALMKDKQPQNDFYSTAPGNRFCVLTSEYRIAYLKAISVRADSDFYRNEITFDATVWDVPDLPESEKG
ncbi:hypothetical protein [Streptomyces sp. NPDC088757]|uniref:hypothetical protein n=1 Tax=Streptomyces sp. NPDC088757 TaxID=3365889 RepID=UPI0038066702